MRRSCLVALTFAFALASGAEGQTPRAPHQRPTDLKSEEGGLWYVSEKAELAAKASGDLDTDPALNAYVKQVECKVAPEYCDEIRIYILDRPFFNAMAAPNGYIEVWSGALLRARDEAELAFILGHETTHYACNHALAEREALKERMEAVLPIGILAAPFVGALVLDIGYLGAVASFEHYSREQEMAADSGGFDRLIAAGYDPSAAPAIWQAVIDEQSHSAFEKVREQHGRAGLFDDHPLEGERLDALSALAKGKPAGDLGLARYRDALRPHLAEFLRDDLRRRDTSETLAIIDHIGADDPSDVSLLNYFRGECYRLRRGPGDVDQAERAYLAATATPDAPPPAWRELGALYADQHQTEKARAAYQAYLDHAPNADDRWLVEGAMKRLDQSEGT